MFQWHDLAAHLGQVGPYGDVELLRHAIIHFGAQLFVPWPALLVCGPRGVGVSMGYTVRAHGARSTRGKATASGRPWP